MANTFAPNGFKQFRHIEGAAPTMGVETFRIAPTDTSLIFTGDPVCSVQAAGLSTLGLSPAAGGGFGRYITGFGSTMPGGAGSSIVLGTTVPVVGIFLGCKQFVPAVGRVVWFAQYLGAQVGSNLPDIEAYVCTDPEMLFVAQASTNVTITSTCLGQGIGFGWVSSGPGFQSSNPTGNTFSGQSGACLLSSNMSAGGAGSTLPFVLFDFAGTYSGGAGQASWDVSPTIGSGSFFAGGLDPTSAGAAMIVKPNGWTYGARPASSFGV